MFQDTPEAALAHYELLRRIERGGEATPLTGGNLCLRSEWSWLRLRLYQLQPFCFDRAIAIRVLVAMLSAGCRAQHLPYGLRKEPHG